MENREIEVREETGLASDVSPARWTMMLSQAETIVKSSLAPKADTKETVVVKILAGRELGFSAMQSLRLLYVVGQKVAMMSDATAGLVLQRLPGAQIDCVETTDKIATFEASRPGGKVTRLSFTWAEAVKAGLTGGTGWQKYPAQMLRARCQIAICRLVFPDICAGLYSPDELGDKNAGLGERVPFEDQMAKERERIKKLAHDNIDPSNDESGVDTALQKENEYQAQMAAEKERVAKKELAKAGVIDAEVVKEPEKKGYYPTGKAEIPPEGEKPASVPQEAQELAFDQMTELQKQDNMIFMGTQMFPDSADCANYFIKSSEFTLKEEGKPDKFVKGKDNPYNLHTGRLLNTYKRIKKDYDEWKVNNG